MSPRIEARAVVVVVLSALALVAACDNKSVGSPVDAGQSDGSWTPPIENLGEPGWRDSDEPWDPVEHDSRLAFDVWSRPGAVYVLHGGIHDSWGPDDTGDPCGYRISVNDGTGWQTLVEWGEDSGMYSPAELRLTGFSDGRILTRFPDSGMGELGIITDNGTASGQGFTALDVFVVSDNLVYAISNLEDKIVRFNGAGWEPVPVEMPYYVSCVWADATSLFAVGSSGTILSLEGDSWRIHDSGTLDSFTAIWGFAEDDVWVGSAEGYLFHWDGQVWNEVPWPDALAGTEHYASIGGMWGADGVLYFHTFWQLVRVDSSGLHNIAAWPCEEREDPNGGTSCEGGVKINAIWGNSPEELFLAVNAPLDHAGDDQNVFLLWYDGAQFHWF